MSLSLSHWYPGSGIQYKFVEIPSIGYLVMDGDGKDLEQSLIQSSQILRVCG